MTAAPDIRAEEILPDHDVRSEDDMTPIRIRVVATRIAQVLPEVQNGQAIDPCLVDRAVTAGRPILAASDGSEKDTPMLRASLSIILLAGWTAAIPVAHPAAEGQIQKLTIKGSIAYETSAALPPDSRMVIELRHLPALPNAPAAAALRIDLEGKQSPVPFEFIIERYRLVGGGTYVVRGAIVSENRAIWTPDDIKFVVPPSSVDVKEITLTR